MRFACFCVGMKPRVFATTKCESCRIRSKMIAENSWNDGNLDNPETRNRFEELQKEMKNRNQVCPHCPSGDFTNMMKQLFLQKKVFFDKLNSAFAENDSEKYNPFLDILAHVSQMVFCFFSC